jgi:uncharacterized protein YecE (DUF72 family)
LPSLPADGHHTSSLAARAPRTARRRARIVCSGWNYQALARALLPRGPRSVCELAGARRRAWIYFNNDAEGAALEDAATLRELLADLA